jgi:2'-5' RNA ligase
VSGTSRLFVAAWLPAPLRQEAAGMLGRLRESEAEVRWVPPENLHVTLQFLGDVEAERAEELVGLLRGALAGASAFPLALSGLGTFPARGVPRVVWAGFACGGRELAALASRLERVLVPAGFLAPSDRPFRAHVTLGRPRSRRGGTPRGMESLRALLEQLPAPAGEERLLEEVKLAASTLSPRGAHYREVARFPLAPAGPREGEEG